MTGAGLARSRQSLRAVSVRARLGSPGTAVFAGIEGTRPLLVEIQALVAPTSLGTPRRAVVGWDQNWLSMVLAVLEAHCGVRLSGHDVYLNVAGGLRSTSRQPISPRPLHWFPRWRARRFPPMPSISAKFTVGGGAAGGADRGAAERGKKLGFTKAVVPDGARNDAPDGFSLTAIGTLANLVADIARDGTPALRRVGRQDS